MNFNVLYEVKKYAFGRFAADDRSVYCTCKLLLKLYAGDNCHTFDKISTGLLYSHFDIPRFQNFYCRDAPFLTPRLPGSKFKVPLRRKLMHFFSVFFNATLFNMFKKR